jgi:hypothetical protein
MTAVQPLPSNYILTHKHTQYLYWTHNIASENILRCNFDLPHKKLIELWMVRMTENYQPLSAVRFYVVFSG